MDPLNPWVDAAEMMRLAEALLAPPPAQTRAPEDAGFGGDFIGYAPQATAPVSQQVTALPLSPIPIPAPTPSPASAQPYLPPSILETPQAPPQLAAAPPQTIPLPHHTRPIAPVSSPIPTPAATIPPSSDISMTEVTPVAEVPPVSAVVAPPEPAAPLAPATKSRGPFLERMVHFCAMMHQHLAAKGVFILDKDGAVIYDDANHGKLYFMARSLALAAKNPHDNTGNVHVRVGSTTTLVVIPAATVFGKMVLGILVDHALPADVIPQIVRTLHNAVSPPQPS